jgi:hypothetical protein
MGFGQVGAGAGGMGLTQQQQQQAQAQQQQQQLAAAAAAMSVGQQQQTQDGRRGVGAQRIREVWRANLEEEMAKLRILIKKYPYVSMVS